MVGVYLRPAVAYPPAGAPPTYGAGAWAYPTGAAAPPPHPHGAGGGGAPHPHPPPPRDGRDGREMGGRAGSPLERE